MKNLLILSMTLALGLLGLPGKAQENIGAKEIKVNSPVVAADNSVTFNLVAPEARSVYLTGNWMVQKPQELPKVAMKKDASGLWSVKQDRKSTRLNSSH